MNREVFKARDRKTNRIVALKKVRMENEKEGVGLYDTGIFWSVLDIELFGLTVSNDCFERNSHPSAP